MASLVLDLIYANTSHESRDVTGLLALHDLFLMLCICELKGQKVFEGSDTILVLRRCFLARLLQVDEKGIFFQALTVGASVTTMRGTRDNHIGDVQCIDISLATSGGLQVYRYTDKKEDHKL